MISYAPLWETLLKKGVTTYDLIYRQGVPANTIHRMKHGKPVTTTTLEQLCDILDCTLPDIVVYLRDGGDAQGP